MRDSGLRYPFSSFFWCFGFPALRFSAFQFPVFSFLRCGFLSSAFSYFHFPLIHFAVILSLFPFFLFCSRLMPSGISCSNPPPGSRLLSSFQLPVLRPSAIVPPLSRPPPAHYCSNGHTSRQFPHRMQCSFCISKGTCAVVYTRLGGIWKDSFRIRGIAW